jgi:septal ring factor EnvC (AmiA/AmiB activator)
VAPLNRGVLLVLLAGSLGGLRLGAAATSPPAAADLAALRTEIGRLEEQLRRVKVVAGDLGATLAQLGVELTLQQTRVEEAAASRGQADQAVASASEAAAVLETRVVAQRQGLKRSLSTLYRMGRGLPIRALLSLRADQDLPAAVRSLRYLALRDFRAVAAYRETRERLELERRVLTTRREEAASWLGRERERQAQLLTLRSRQERLLAANLGEARRLAGLAENLSDRESRLTTLLDLLSRGASELEGRSARDFKGALEWPVAARVAAEFGPRLDPRYKTRVPHRGLDLTTEPGAEVRSVYGGRVLYAGAFEDLGNLVVVRHPGGVTTLTSGLQALRVAKDDVLTFGSVVGRASEIVYFEVRVEQRPEDPREWLRPLLSSR